MTLETPIVKVISLLIDVQDKCPQHVSSSIEEALEILRSPDLYTPPAPPPAALSDLMSSCGSGGDNATSGGDVRTKKEADADEITTDLFTGLIHSNKPISGIRRMSYEAAVAHRQSFSSLRDFSPALMAGGTSGGSGVAASSSSGVITSSGGHIPMPSLSNIPDNIKEMLASQLDWDFDIIRLEQMTSRRPLVWLGLSILSHFNVCSTLSCDEATLRNWLQMIETNYRDNPYHNSTHASDVMQATAYFLSKPRIEAIFDPLDEAISLIAAVCHDIDHPGKSSAFLCNSGHELAILYNDISVLESHHAALTFKLTLSDPNVNIFKNLDRETFKEVRHSVVDMILATEMTKHFEHLTKFVNVFTKSLSIDEGDNSSTKSSSSVGDRNSSSAPVTSSSTAPLNNQSSQGTQQQQGPLHISRDSPGRLRSLSLNSPENVVLIKRMLIKCADVSNPTRPLSLCVAWGNRIAEEYCNQTDEEKALGLPVVMPVFDRSTCSIPKAQVC